MYHNDSNRLLTEAYKDNISEMQEKEQQVMVEAITKRVQNIVPPLIELTTNRIKSLRNLKADLVEDPERFSMFVRSIKAEKAKVVKAINSAEDLLRDLEKLQTLIEFLTINPKTPEDAKRDFETLADIRELLNDILLEDDDERPGGVLASVISYVKNLDIFNTTSSKGSLSDTEDRIRKLDIDF